MPDRVVESEGDCVTVRLLDALGVTVTEEVTDGVAAALGVGEPDRVPEPVLEGVNEAVDEPVGVGAGLRDAVPVSEPVLLRVLLCDGVGWADGVAVSVPVREGDGVAVAVPLGVTALDAVLELVCEPLCDRVGWTDEVAVIVVVPEGERVSVAVTLGVAVTVGVGLGDRLSVPAWEGVRETVAVTVVVPEGEGVSVDDCVCDAVTACPWGSSARMQTRKAALEVILITMTTRKHAKTQVVDVQLGNRGSTHPTAEVGAALSQVAADLPVTIELSRVQQIKLPSEAEAGAVRGSAKRHRIVQRRPTIPLFWSLGSTLR